MGRYVDGIRRGIGSPRVENLRKGETGQKWAERLNKELDVWHREFLMEWPSRVIETSA